MLASSLSNHVPQAGLLTNAIAFVLTNVALQRVCIGQMTAYECETCGTCCSFYGTCSNMSSLFVVIDLQVIRRTRISFGYFSVLICPRKGIWSPPAEASHTHTWYEQL